MAFARAAAYLELSAHSAEQAASTARYLQVLSRAMGGVSRGVLRAQMCASLRSVLARLMDAPTDALALEWRDFCAAGTPEALSWWASYTATYEAAFKWAKKPTHAPFCYQLLVSMLALAALPDCAPGGAEFATPARRGRMLKLLVDAKKEPLRSSCVPLAAQHVCALPAEAVRADLAGPPKPSASSAASSVSLKVLVATLLPRKAALLPAETAHIERLLFNLATAQPDCAYVLSLITESLGPAGAAASSPSQRALLLRLLATLSVERPDAVRPHQHALLHSLRPMLRHEAHQHLAAASAAAAAAAGGPPVPESEGSGLLPAVIGAVPRLWALEVDAEEDADLAWLARLLCSDERETNAAAVDCLQLLMTLQRSRLTVPVLSAVARMLLARDGARPMQLSRALNYAMFLVKVLVTALARALLPAPTPRAPLTTIVRPTQAHSTSHRP